MFEIPFLFSHVVLLIFIVVLRVFTLDCDMELLSMSAIISMSCEWCILLFAYYNVLKKAMKMLIQDTIDIMVQFAHPHSIFVGCIDGLVVLELKKEVP